MKSNLDGQCEPEFHSFSPLVIKFPATICINYFCSDCQVICHTNTATKCKVIDKSQTCPKNTSIFGLVKLFVLQCRCILLHEWMTIWYTTTQGDSHVGVKEEIYWFPQWYGGKSTKQVWDDRTAIPGWTERFGWMYYSIPGRTSCPQAVHDFDMPLSLLDQVRRCWYYTPICICERLTGGSLLNLQCTNHVFHVARVGWE